jgi:hypothetical protein
MSCRRRCDIWKATDGKWYMLLGKFEDADEENDCDAFGPFSSEEAAGRELRNHSNPGGFTTDDSGTRPPPKKITPRRRIGHVW